MKKFTYSRLVKSDYKQWQENFPFNTDDEICYSEGFSDGVWNLMIAMRHSKLLSLSEIQSILEQFDPKGESLASTILSDWIYEEMEENGEIA
jgi:hypothetical protein